MIETSEAIRMARALIGTPYSELDCINLIKKVIRTAPGGDKNYTTAGTNDLWNSDGKSAKYRDLTWKQEGISGAKAGMLAFMGVGTGDVSHTGLVTERGIDDNNKSFYKHEIQFSALKGNINGELVAVRWTATAT